MNFIFTLAATAILVVSSAASPVVEPLTVITPVNSVQCENQNVDWRGGLPMFWITDNGNTIVDIHDVAAPAFFWNTNIPGGHVGVVELIDSTGATALSAPFTVAPSNNATCLE
ncbi:hypothetical protein C8Q76DRAFT_799560 [Earliella scabrosa]|nr:hypothetical protein C8Q76DRAFT_799560 [Earliella scabrosa]